MTRSVRRSGVTKGQCVRQAAGSLLVVLTNCFLVAASAGDLGEISRSFFEVHCYDCHDAETKSGGLDLTALKYDPADRDRLAKWIRIHDRVSSGEMPPKDAERPADTARTAFVSALHQQLYADDRGRIAREGRATQRRLNLEEYENALRDLLGAPWLSLKSKFPADGVAAGYNKSSAALDLSHVQLERYLSVAEHAIQEVIQQRLDQLTTPPINQRFYIRDQEEITTFLTGSITFIPTNIDRRPIPVLGFQAQPDVRLLKVPFTAGAANPEVRNHEALAFLSRYNEGFRPHWNEAKIPASGFYKLRICGYTLTIAAGQTRDKSGSLAGQVNQDQIFRGRRNEPVVLYAIRDGDIYFGERREIGAELDLTPEPAVYKLGPVWLRKNEALVTDPVRLFRAPPPGWKGTKNPHLTDDGAPAVAFRWIEIEGPLPDSAADAGVQLLLGDLPLKELPQPETVAAVNQEPANKVDGVTRSLMRESGVDRPKAAQPIPFEIVSHEPHQDAKRLLERFGQRAYRRPIDAGELEDFRRLVNARLQAGSSFAQSLIAGYKALLSSPGFLLLEESPGPLDDHALATRLALFLWNSPPDAELRELADLGRLRETSVLQAQTERLLADRKSQRFVDAFLDYWLDLRKRNDTEPSGTLYTDYFLDDALVNAAIQESRLTFADLIARDLPARHVAASNFTYLNERLARHYGVPSVQGISLRRVELPRGSVRGGFLTQAAVLKVTACGTTTSPVVRGKWMNERIMGVEIPPPPAAVPAVEPDIRGATTLREQLAQHRSNVNCSSCHLKVDPPGFALENFDVMGGWRDRYRAMDDAKPSVPGYGYNGVPFAFHEGPAVDAAGQFADGVPFRDIRDFKERLIQDQPALARNLVCHLLVYATGTPPTYSDRAQIDQIVKASESNAYGVRTLIHGIVQSEMFRKK